MAASREAFALERARAEIVSGGVVLHATEGVWGLACDAQNPRAIRRLLALKHRAVGKGLIVIGHSAQVFALEIAGLPREVQNSIKESWPGAVTWVLPNQRFCVEVTGGRKTVAVRVPDHAQARALCRAVGGPLVSTSANIAARPAPRTALQARRAMGARVDFVLPGETAGRPGPSEVRSWQGEVFRGASQ